MKKILTLLLLVLVIYGVFYGFKAYQAKQRARIEAIEIAAERFVSDNITELSDERETLGGKFFVIKISSFFIPQRSEVRGKVDYEDGHNSYVASYILHVNPNGSFKPVLFKPEY